MEKKSENAQGAGGLPARRFAAVQEPGRAEVQAHADDLTSRYRMMDDVEHAAFHGLETLLA
ncbi:MAG: hypothetical protein ACOX9C_06125 [Kiritimatiellia bacterium]|jgi:hypothetical protein